MRDHPDQRPLQLADVLRNLVRDEGQDVLWDQAGIGTYLGFQDRHARLEIGRLNVSDQAPLKARPQPILERRNLFRRAVRGDHDLAIELV